MRSALRIRFDQEIRDSGKIGIADRIKHVPSQGVALGDARVIEVEFRKMFHSYFFHYVSGTNIGGYRDGNDFF